MRPLPLLIFFFAGCAVAFAGSAFLEISNQLIASPAGLGSAASQLATGADGSVAMSWIEPTSSEGGRALRLALFDAQKKAWRPARTVAEGSDFILNFSSTPQIAINSAGVIAVVWYLTNPANEAEKFPTYHAMISRSDDHGATWSSPVLLTKESLTHEFLSLTALSDGRFLAVWLDARSKTGHQGGEQSLRARILFSDAPDALLDARVCDCCATSVVAFPDGSALAIYRDRSEDEIRDISSLRFKDNAWSEPRKLSRDEWKIAGCPINGPVISAATTRTAAAWYTAAEGQPKVMLSTSSNAGEAFVTPRRIDDGKALGYVDVVQLGIGPSLVSWVEAGEAAGEAIIWLRRIASDGSLSVPVRLATTTRDRACGVPRLTLVKDQDATSPAQLLLSYTLVEGKLPHVTTRLLALAPQQDDRPPCAQCPPTSEKGSPVHGYIQNIDTKTGLAKVKHDDIPGLMPAMTMKFHVAPDELAGIKADAEIFGRVEQREEGWWLFGIRVVERPKTK